MGQRSHPLSRQRFRWMIRLVLSIQFVLGSLLVALSVTPARTLAQTYPGQIGVGVTMGWTLPFVDAAKTLRAFELAGGGPAPTDSNGWPTSDARTVLWDMRPVAAWAGEIDDPQHFMPNMAGTYKLSFNGQATLSRVDGNFTIQNQTYDAATNTTRADLVVPPDTNEWNNLVFIDFSNTKRTPTSATNTGITNLKVIRPGYPANTTQTFHTPFLNALRSASFSTLRFMGWTGTNSSNYDYPRRIEWSERKLPTDATQEPWGNKLDGGAWEYVIELGNTVDKDIWINVPVHASDDYIRQLATLIKNTLEPERKVYVEYSNEVWNWSFWQATWNKQNAEAQGLNYIKGYAKRTVEISQIFASVFGASAINNRIRVINAWQIGWNPPDAQYEEQMQYINSTFGPPKNYIWGLAVAPYHNCEPVCTTGSPQQILDAMRANSDASVSARQKVKAVADRWQLPGGLLAYEGGSDTGGGDKTNVANKIAAERSPGMKDVMIHDLRDNWFPIGGGLFMYLELVSGYNRYGSWGLTDDVTNPDRNYKFAAVRELLGDTGTPPTATPTPTPTPTPPSGGTGTGLRGEYYDTIDFTALKLTRTDATVDFDWGSGAPDPSMGADTFSVRWTGQVEAPVSGSYTFYTTSDDGIRLWVNGQQLINNWTDHPPTENSGTITLTGGQKYDLKLEFYENGGGAVAKLAWAYPGQSKQIIPQSRLYPPPSGGTGTGLRGEYFNNVGLSGSPALVRTDPQVDFDWGGNAPASGVNYDNFSVRWTGQVEAPVSGSYTFATVSDDGVRLWVNGQQLIDNWTDHPPTTNTAAPVTLTAGQRYDLRMEFYDRTGGAVARLLWSYPGQSQQAIPQIRLYPAGGTTPTPTATPAPTATPTPQPTATPGAGGGLLAYDSFSSSAGPLDQTAGGTGWSAAWFVQNNDTSVPGYNIANSAPLSYNSLQTSGNYAIGGDAYQTAGRGLNVSSGGPFDTYLTNGLIGRSGTTLWMSALLRKDVNNDQEVSLVLHANNIAWCTNCSGPLVSVGYFGSASNNNGTRYWSLRIGTTVYRSDVPLTVGQTALLVVRLDFGSTNTATLYVNPSSLGGSAPASANAQATTTNNIAFKNLAYYGGDGFNQSAVDEIRFGTSFAAVTPPRS